RALLHTGLLFNFLVQEKASFISRRTVRCLFSICDMKFEIGHFPISPTIYRQSMTNEKLQLRYGK
ncbi:MAG TPA: hypothetical protein PKD31_28175, partial [Blastocatellia bacterium]|nr:hypothetical protein [Blastocatellia bacterium]